HSNLKVLITSRHTNWSAGLGLKRLPLGEFSSTESLEFLRKYIAPERENDVALEKLAEHLGYLPLALELAGRYLEKQPRLKIQEYLEQTKNALSHKSMQNWKVEQKSLTGHDLSLAQTFAQSWIFVKDETAQKLFTTLGYCAPNTPIPQAILDAALGDPTDACDEAISELTGLGLLKEGHSIHPLLAEFARGLDEDNHLLKPFSEALANLANQTNSDEDQTGNYALYTPLLPHLRVVAEYAEAAALEPAGELWNSIGYHIKDLADHAGAKAAFERALKIFENVLGEDHPNVATLINNLGGVLKALGDHAGAKAAFERALKIDEATFGPDHPDVAIDVNNLGMVLKDLGDHAGAKAAFERALKIDEATFGPDHPSVAIRVNNLGGVLRALGDHAGAKAAYERALKIDEATFGPDHPNVGTEVNNLGLVLEDLGDHAGAKAAFERALRIFEKFLPPDHPNIKIVRGNLESLNQEDS
ncbi:MAG TPA: tetratricopeptide repeat protein, partial [Anaerolineales bacterium]|nr:tetratricopeptide repeat protein [Anaerolineales bacterium]